MLTTLLACHDTAEATADTALAGFDGLFQWPGPLFMIGGVVAIVGIAGGTLSSIIRTRAREQTRRELAAYVAEGTLDPDKAVEILKAAPPEE